MTATKTVAEKLALKPGTTFWTSHPDRLAIIGDLPSGVTVAGALADAGVALLFADDADSARAILDAHRKDLTKPPAVWVAYPKANRTDINRDTLWPLVVPYGLRPNGQVALDDAWSALRFRATRDGEAPFTGGKKS